MGKWGSGLRLAVTAALIAATGGSARLIPDYILVIDPASVPVPEPIVPRLPPAPDLSTLEGRTEAAIIDQLSCTKPVRPAKVINAMLRNRLLKETADQADGSSVYNPTRPLAVFGVPLIHVTGWQMKVDSGDGEPPFVRVPGLPPADFLSVTVLASASQIRSAAMALGIRERLWGGPGEGAAGIEVKEGDMWRVEKKMEGVTTLSCHTEWSDFPEAYDAMDRKALRAALKSRRAHASR